jgi:hypothetical protein
LILGYYVLQENSPGVVKAPEAISIASLGEEAVTLAGGMPMVAGDSAGAMSTPGNTLDKVNPLNVAKAGATFLIKLFKDSAFQEME